ncbi:MAG: D-tyrosyl-tRNA(Tyr) deacylase [Chloroflexi bacterium]|nr:D-tyrosyl-tRNA(Tyr) deacylase [Chloroflexota bacterium]
MKALLQRVNLGRVTVAGELVAEIGCGLAVLVGVARDDLEEDAAYLADRAIHLRIFDDAQGKFNLSALDVRAELLVVSQFTLLADTRKGRRPGFTGAASPELAQPLFNRFVEHVQGWGLKAVTGRFQQHMLVEIHNDGPVTVMLDSRDRLLPRRAST